MSFAAKLNRELPPSFLKNGMPKEEFQFLFHVLPETIVFTFLILSMTSQMIQKERLKERNRGKKVKDTKKEEEETKGR